MVDARGMYSGDGGTPVPDSVPAVSSARERGTSGSDVKAPVLFTTTRNDSALRQ